MKLFLPTTLLFLGISLSAQMPGMMTVQSGSQGTALGANETLAYNGNALGNSVKMRGYVDFIFSHIDNGDSTTNNPTDFSTAGDVDFLFDLSPVTAELHLAMNPDAAKEVDLEEAFGRYSFNNMFHLTFGRQLTALGFEADEAPGLYAVTNAYKKGSRRNYVDGLRANFNNGQFGFVLGLHDFYLHKFLR